MSITTLDGALAGMQPPIAFAKASVTPKAAGEPISYWYAAGFPGAGATSAFTSGGIPLSSSSAMITGQVPHIDPGVGNSYLGRLSGVAGGQSGLLMLCDRLLHCAGTTAGTQISVTTTTAQTLSTVALPSRDSTGTTAGVGVMAALEIAGTMGAASPGAITLTYTNSAGVGSKNATILDNGQSADAVGGFHRFSLQAGDLGVRSVQQITIPTSWVSGTIVVVLYRVIAALELPATYVPNAIDALTAGFPQIFNGAVPFFVAITPAASATTISGTYTETQG